VEFDRAIQVLCDAKVEFVVVGGLAATLHGSARVTYDLDICYARSRDNLRRLALALEPYHPRPRGFPEGVPFVWDETTLHNATVLTLDTDIGEIDLLAEIAGLGDFDRVSQNSVAVTIFERRIQALDLESLIRSKKAAGRPKDIEAVKELQSLMEAGE
jgi:predicted nucleotidyltransferase